MSVGIMQIVGFAVCGVPLTVMSPRGTLLAGAALYVVSGILSYAGLSRRPARAKGRPSAAQTWRNNVLLLASAPRRYVTSGCACRTG